MNKLDPVVFKLGAAVLLCQIFENSLVLLHRLIDKEEDDQGTTVRIGSDYTKHTLGKLVNLLKKRIEVPPNAMEFIFQAIETRNEIINGYLTSPENMVKFESDEGLDYLVGDLVDKTKAVRSSDLVICQLIDQYLTKYVTSTEKLKQLAEEHSNLYRDD